MTEGKRCSLTSFEMEFVLLNTLLTVRCLRIDFLQLNLSADEEKSHSQFFATNFSVASIDVIIERLFDSSRSKLGRVQLDVLTF